MDPHFTNTFFVFTLVLVTVCRTHAYFTAFFGDLGEVDSSTAVMGMSGSSVIADKQSWWHFLDSTKFNTSYQAFLQYMISNVPAEYGTKDSLQRHKEALKHEIELKRGLFATKNASVAEYHEVKYIKGIGRMEVNLWMLAYICLTEECTSLVPVSLMNDDDLENLEPVSMWEVMFPYTGFKNEHPRRGKNYFVLNAVTSSILQFTGYTLPLNDNRLPGLKVRYISSTDLSKCSGSPTRVGRSLTATYYNDGPFQCLNMGPAFENVTNNPNLLLLGNKFTVDFPFQIVSLTDCEDAPVLVQLNATSYLACSSRHRSFDVYSCTVVEYSCTHDTLNYFSAIYKVYESGRDESVTLEEQLCHQGKNIWVKKMKSLPFVEGRGQGTGLPIYNRRDLPASDQLCGMYAGYPQERVSLKLSSLGVLSSSMAQVKSLYLEAHASALNLHEGPPLDFWVSVLALPSAFCSSYCCHCTAHGCTTQVSFSTCLYKQMVSQVLLWSIHLLLVLCSFALVICCNFLSALVTAMVVISVAPAELTREKRKKTWALFPNKLTLLAGEPQIQALFVMHGESFYKSMYMVIGWSSVGALLLVVLLITLYRFHEVLKRLKLLRRIQGVSGDLQLDLLKAVEMTAAEYKKLLHTPAQELQLLIKNGSSEASTNQVVEPAVTHVSLRVMSRSLIILSYEGPTLSKCFK